VPILPDRLYWQAFVVLKFGYALAALHIRQTQHLQDLGSKNKL